jgi:hypothetical protein
MERQVSTRYGRRTSLVHGWFQDKGTEACVYGYGTRINHSFILGQYARVFQAEVYVIKACTMKTLDRRYRNRNIYILLHNQTAVST